MIEPFEDGQRREGTISYGLSSYGYDARVATSSSSSPMSTMRSSTRRTSAPTASSTADRRLHHPAQQLRACPHGRIFRVPRDVLVICLGKSTYARCGIIVNVTPLEPGWEAM
jgi:dCTP deaminase